MSAIEHDLFIECMKSATRSNFEAGILTDMPNIADNWDRLTAYFQYSQHIRRIIYTTNTVEGYHRQLRRVTKNKGVFTSDTALEKLVYLAFTRIQKKWTQPVQNWGQTAQQLAILFPDRFRILA